MSIEEIMPTHAHRLAHFRVPRWFQYHHQARKDVLQSAQNAADQTGEPQFIIDAKTQLSSEMVVQDLRRAMACNPGRFRRMNALEAQEAYLAEQALLPPSSDDDGVPA